MRGGSPSRSVGVGTFVGRADTGWLAGDNRCAQEVFESLVHLAGKNGDEDVTQNSVMEG
jgi:hypothetical protein